MVPLRWIVVALALFLAGWFAFEGGRALVVGDYITPKSGRYAGQLGPWSHVVEAIGLEPRSTFMKTIFLVYGLAWLALTARFALRARGSWWPMMIASIGALWYLPFGTLICAVIIALLLTPPVRRQAKI